MPPRMFIIAGPPGAGKSSLFNLSAVASRTFNADDRAAQLNGGSYRDIPLWVRQIVNQEFEKFVLESIDAKQSFALETTLRSNITFEQARLAQKQGFAVYMAYVALASAELHLERVKRRAALGGHSASEATLRRIHSNSLANLATVLNPEVSGIEFVQIFDNSLLDQQPILILEVIQGRINFISSEVPRWLSIALNWTEEDIRAMKNSIGQNS